MGNVERYRTLILGDFHYGESYIGEGERSLADHGYDHSTVHLKRFVEACDSFILNLETPLVTPAEYPAPVKKAYLHWGDPQNTVTQLNKLNVDAVSLGNNHTLDRGYGGLEATFQTLSDAGISWFGAGRDIDEAQAPYRVVLPGRVGGGEIHFHGSYQYASHNEKFGSYADEYSPGCAPLREAAVPPARTPATRSDTFQVAFPHWGANYKWRGKLQYRLAHRLLNKDYDLVLGHGGHAMQEILRKQRRWVIYGLGNGNFMSAGRWQRFEEENGILPFSFWAILEVILHENGNRQLELKLYPVYSDNQATNYQPQPVSSADFQRALRALDRRSARPWRFHNSAKSIGKDHLGHFILLRLGEWPLETRASRLPSPTNNNYDPGDWPLRSPSLELEDKVLGLNKHMGASIMALGAKADGGSAQWVSWKTALLEVGSKRLFARGYGAHESVLGAAIALDKVLTAELLEQNQVSTPLTIVAESENAAVEAASEISGPVVVKPRNGVKSIGVTTNLVTEVEVREAFRYARKFRNDIIVQQYIETSEELRVMASPQGAVAVIKRVLPHVVGDGLSTIQQLIKDKNRQRALNPSLWRRAIPLDAQTERHLYKVGLALESVPKMGETITVRNVAGLSVGADAFQALEATDPQVTDTAVGAVAAIPGMNWGGVDVIIEKGTRRPFVIEINDDAGFGQALFPTYGEPRNVGRQAWQLRLAATAPEVQSPPALAPVNEYPSPLISHTTKQQKSSVSFAQLFERSLLRQGFTFDRRNSRVRLIKSPSGDAVWTTVSGRTCEDRNVVQRVMSNHQMVYRILEVAGIPRVTGRNVVSPVELRAFLQRGARNVILTPTSNSWRGPYYNQLPAKQAHEWKSLPDTMWVQSRFQGRRVRVLATRYTSAVTTALSPQGSLQEEHILKAGRLAVEAVRAVPELRWAAVDILIRPTRLREGRRGGLLVEGISMRPRYSPLDQVIAGDFDAFCRSLIPTASSY